MEDIRYDLVPPKGLEEVCKVLTSKLEKYNKNEWKFGLKWSDVLSSLKKHLSEFEQGHDYTPEGCLSIAEVAANSLILADYISTYPQGDDRVLHVNQPRISLDVDDCCADFLGYFQRYFNTTLNPYWKGSYKMEEMLNKIKDDKDFWLNIPVLHRPPVEVDLYVSSRSIPVEWTMEWLQKNGFPCAPVVHVPWNESKIEVLKEYKIDVHCDDKVQNYRDCIREGIFCYLVTAPHNTYLDVGSRRIESLLDLKGIK